MSVPIYNPIDIEKSPSCKLGELGKTDMFTYLNNDIGTYDLYIIINVDDEYGYECMNLLSGETIWFSGCDKVKRVRKYELCFEKLYRVVKRCE